MKTRRILAFVSVLVLCLSLASVAFADGAPADSASKSESILLDKGVPADQLDKISQSDMDSLVQQANAYNFTDDQVQKYVQGLLKDADFVKNASNETAVYDKETGTFKTSTGEWPNLFRDWKSPTDNPLMDLQYDTNRSVTTYRNFVKPSDQTGTFWGVMSNSGYLEATTYLDVATISNLDSDNVPYMMISANTKPTSIAGDYGIGYINGAWYPVANWSEWNGTTHDYDYSWDQGSSIPSGLTHLYIDVKATNGSSRDSITYRLLDGDDFSNTLWSKTITFKTYNPIFSDASNLNLYKIASVAQKSKGSLNTNTGTWMRNARFSLSWLYNNRGNWRWEPARTSDAYRQAPTRDGCNTVDVNLFYPWYQDDISIRFNR